MISSKMKRAALGTAIAAALAVGLAASASAPAVAQPAVAPANDVTLSVGTGRMVRLSGTMSDLFVANPEIADVQVRSPSQIYIFGKTAGTTTVYATDAGGRVVYSATVRVGQNLGSVGQMLSLAMPEANIVATPMNGMVLLTGTVAQPDDAAEAERLVQAFVGENTQVVSRLRTATPQQVMLQVRIAEVSRTLLREIGTNLLSRDSTGGFLFGIGRGNPGTINVTAGTPNPVTGVAPQTYTGVTFNNSPTATTLGAAGRLFGLNLLGTMDLGETTGLVHTLAEPTLVALSGETSSFLAGGEFPIPVAQQLNQVTIEYKQYGVGLAFSPIVLEDGRIQMRVRPEVSQLSDAGSIRLNGFTVPSLTVRRAETTVELGSGQSFMIAGLLQNNNSNSINRAPFLGNIPILGALFRSTRYQREETELVIVVTPYLVRPVSNPNQIALPTDGYRNPDEAQRLLIGQDNAGRSGEQRPGPDVAPARTVAPGIGTVGEATPAGPARPPAPAPAREVSAAAAPPPSQPRASASSAQPGFNF
ncbi:MAG: type II and III secretion system protein family protein [Sphingomonadaceae bacterium]|nr:type II and III secretion system protein family protein [Sphingomonadaceae bacterium]